MWLVRAGGRGAKWLKARGPQRHARVASSSRRRRACQPDGRRPGRSRLQDGAPHARSVASVTWCAAGPVPCAAAPGVPQAHQRPHKQDVVAGRPPLQRVRAGGACCSGGGRWRLTDPNSRLPMSGALFMSTGCIRARKGARCHEHSTTRHLTRSLWAPWSSYEGFRVSHVPPHASMFAVHGLGRSKKRRRPWSCLPGHVNSNSCARSPICITRFLLITLVCSCMPACRGWRDLPGRPAPVVRCQP